MSAPAQITVHTTSGRLSLTWSDGRTQSISNAALRERCPCSTCRRLTLSGRSVSIEPELSLLDLQPMGYGIQIIFTDGHAQGIYPWDYLRSLEKDEMPAAEAVASADQNAPLRSSPPMR